MLHYFSRFICLWVNAMDRIKTDLTYLEKLTSYPSTLTLGLSAVCALSVWVYLLYIAAFLMIYYMG